MTITQRILRPYKSTATNERLSPEENLDGIAVTNMMGILAQLGQLSQFASEVFQGLYEGASATGKRVAHLSGRIGSLEQSATSVESTFRENPPSHFFAQSRPAGQYRRQDELPHSLFMANTQPLAMQRARAEVRPAPQLSLLDGLTAEPAMKKFSNPQFFFEEWLKAEAEKQKDMQEERKKRMERRKDKKNKENKPKRVIAKAEAVQVKVYSAQGAEFASGPQTRPATATTQPTMQQPVQATTITVQAPLRPQLAQPSATPAAEPAPRAGGPPPPPPVMGGGAPPAPPPIPSSGDSMMVPRMAPPPPPPVNMGSVPTPPPVQRPSMMVGGAPPPPPVPNHYAAPPIPPAPAVFIPEAPPLVDDQPMVMGGGEEGIPTAEDNANPAAASSLMEQIRLGGMKNLKKTEPQQAAPPANDRGGLLAEIRNRNFQLKKIDPASKPAAATPAPAAGGGMSSIMAILQRRAAIQGSDDEESEDDDDWNN